jgi:hypothetical protein
MKVENTAENSVDAIDARIDVVIGTLPAGPTKSLITEVYRPFCKRMMKMNQVEDVDEVVRAVAVLVANIVRECAVTTSRDPKRQVLHILHNVKRMLK